MSATHVNAHIATDKISTWILASIFLHIMILAIVPLLRNAGDAPEIFEVDLTLPSLPDPRQLLRPREEEMAAPSREAGTTKSRFSSLLKNLKKEPSTPAATAPARATNEALRGLSDKLKARALSANSGSKFGLLKSSGWALEKAPPKSAREAAPSLPPNLEKEVLAAIGREENALRDCYEGALIQDSKVMGSMALTLVGSGAGRVGDVRLEFQGEGKGAAVDGLKSCLKRSLGRVKLPAGVSAGQEIRFRYLFRG